MKVVNELVTGIVVTYNTKDLFQIAYESVRKFHPDMKIIIVDGSTRNNSCYKYVERLSQKDSNAMTIQVDYNIGHGRGMCIGIYYAQTPYVLLFDSDIKMIKSPVEEMLKMMEEDTFGVGYIEKTGYDGFVYGVHSSHHQEPGVKYLHPYFQLMQISVYKQFYPYVHHGAPCFKTMNDIHKKRLSDKIIKEFPGLGHSWYGVKKEYIQHDVAGTRQMQKKNNLPEIEGIWEK